MEKLAALVAAEKVRDDAQAALAIAEKQFSDAQLEVTTAQRGYREAVDTERRRLQEALK